MPLCAVCFLAGITLLAQAIPSDEFIWDSGPYFPESAAMFRAENTSIEVPTVVRDREQRSVAGLTKDDFQLFDNGKPQTITSFTVLGGPAPAPRPVASGAKAGEAAPTKAEPRFVALFLDDGNTSATYTDAVAALMFGRDAAIKFLKKGLAPGERVGLFTVSGGLTVDFTADTGPLLTALDKLHLKSRQDDQSAGGCPALSACHAWAILHLGETSREFDEAVSAALRCTEVKFLPSKIRIEVAKVLVRTGAEQKAMTSNVWAGAPFDHRIRERSTVVSLP